MTNQETYNSLRDEIETAQLKAENLLWQAQLEVWPDSRRVSLPEAYQWANNSEQLHYVYATLAMALQYPAFVIYECGLQPNGTYQWRGIRIGIKNHEYLSGFPQTLTQDN